MQLIMEQRIFIVKLYYGNEKLQSSSNRVHNFVSRTFTTKWNHNSKKCKKYDRDGTSLNMNKGRSGRRISKRTQENIQVLRQALESNQGRTNARRHRLGISTSSCCRIIQKDLRWYPYKMIRRYNLKNND